MWLSTGWGSYFVITSVFCFDLLFISYLSLSLSLASLWSLAIWIISACEILICTLCKKENSSLFNKFSGGDSENVDIHRGYNY